MNVSTMEKKFLLFIILGIALSPISSFAQDPARFQEEIDTLNQKEYHFEKEQKLVVFTGSSSIRKWKDVQKYYPEYNVINTGFGGSEMSDLFYYIDDTILQYAPDIVFIYEGDNDIAAGESTDEILNDTKKVIERIREELPDTRIYLISPKPSLLRWELAEEYADVNKRLKEYAGTKSHLQFVDVWQPMLNEEGKPIQEIFIEDGLHMNKKGYDIWAGVLDDFLE